MLPTAATLALLPLLAPQADPAWAIELQERLRLPREFAVVSERHTSWRVLEAEEREDALRAAREAYSLRLAELRATAPDQRVEDFVPDALRLPFTRDTTHHITEETLVLADSWKVSTYERHPDGQSIVVHKSFDQHGVVETQVFDGIVQAHYRAPDFGFENSTAGVLLSLVKLRGQLQLLIEAAELVGAELLEPASGSGPWRGEVRIDLGALEARPLLGSESWRRYLPRGFSRTPGWVRLALTGGADDPHLRVEWTDSADAPLYECVARWSPDCPVPDLDTRVFAPGSRALVETSTLASTRMGTATRASRRLGWVRTAGDTVVDQRFGAQLDYTVRADGSVPEDTDLLELVDGLVADAHYQPTREQAFFPELLSSSQAPPLPESSEGGGAGLEELRSARPGWLGSWSIARTWPGLLGIATSGVALVVLASRRASGPGRKRLKA